MTNYNKISKGLQIALESAKQISSEYRFLGISFTDGFYEISLQTPFQRYELYADADTGELVGINAEPVLDFEQLYQNDEEENGLLEKPFSGLAS